MSKQSNNTLLVIGECMMELWEEGNTYHRAFAGDTYNSAVYAKRFQPDIDVQIMTTIGDDSISKAMVAQWEKDHVGYSLVTTSLKAHPGIYAITTDDDGERSFTYWREGSAATELMTFLTSEAKIKITRFDVIFFSGISLAILSDKDKSALLSLIEQAKALGSTIAFDPNYRAVLWDSPEQAKHWLTKAYQLSDIALPGLSDHKEIFGHENNNDVMDWLEYLGVGEIVVKAESEGIYGYTRAERLVHVPITPENNPIDTTGAGDSFAGTYLAARLKGATMRNALQSAAKVAGFVVLHRGAIVDEYLYNNFLSRES